MLKIIRNYLLILLRFLVIWHIWNCTMTLYDSFLLVYVVICLLSLTTGSVGRMSVSEDGSNDVGGGNRRQQLFYTVMLRPGLKRHWRLADRNRMAWYCLGVDWPQCGFFCRGMRCSLCPAAYGMRVCVMMDTGHRFAWAITQTEQPLGAWQNNDLPGSWDGMLGQIWMLTRSKTYQQIYTLF